MTLSDAEEILPLLKSGQVKINQGKKKVIKKNLVNGKKKTVKSFPVCILLLCLLLLLLLVLI